MTDAEIMKGVKLCNGDLGNCKECPFDSIGKTCGIELAKAEIGLIERLQSENAALRNQISEMVMPPCTLGETLYIVACTFGDGYVEDEIVHQSGFSVVKSIVTEKNFYKMCDLVRNGKAFFSQEAAERELEELVGKCKCEFEHIEEEK